MLTIGDTFPSFSLQAVKPGAEGLSLKTCFTTLSDSSRRGQMEGRVLLAEGFHLRLPDRDRRLRQAGRRLRRPRRPWVYGVSTDNEFVHVNWRLNHADLRDLPIPMLSDLKRELSTACGILDKAEGVALRAPPSSSTRRGSSASCRSTTCRSGRNPQEGDAGAGRAAERRAVPLQLEPGRRAPQGRLNLAPNLALALRRGPSSFAE